MLVRSQTLDQIPPKQLLLNTDRLQWVYVVYIIQFTRCVINVALYADDF